MILHCPVCVRNIRVAHNLPICPPACSGHFKNEPTNPRLNLRFSAVQRTPNNPPRCRPHRSCRTSRSRNRWISPSLGQSIQRRLRRCCLSLTVHNSVAAQSHRLPPLPHNVVSSNRSKVDHLHEGKRGVRIMHPAAKYRVICQSVYV